jgi:hypothetical protein
VVHSTSTLLMLVSARDFQISRLEVSTAVLGGGSALADAQLRAKAAGSALDELEEMLKLLKEERTVSWVCTRVFVEKAYSLKTWRVVLRFCNLPRVRVLTPMCAFSCVATSGAPVGSSASRKRCST